MGTMPTRQGDRSSSGSGSGSGCAHDIAVLLGTGTVIFPHGSAARRDREQQGDEGPDGTWEGGQP